MVGVFWMMNMVVGAVNAALIAALLFIYLRNFSALKSRLAVGLLAFAGIFLLQSFGWMYIYWEFAKEYAADVAIPILLMNTLGAAGFGFLFYTTWR